MLRHGIFCLLWVSRIERIPQGGGPHNHPGARGRHSIMLHPKHLLRQLHHMELAR
uniref:Uncharacterized protein n=1 Tax=uncultured marine virus TaxID=186617 RepID=A0A0F7L9B2_9VIRU|nr:hypothetical protein [uncultured marine virus]